MPLVRNTDFEWLTGTSLENFRNDLVEVVPRTPIPMDEKDGYGWFENAKLNLSMNIGRGEHHFAPHMAGKLFRFAKIRAALAEPSLMISSAKSGKVVLQERACGVELPFGPGVDVFHHVDHIDYEPHLVADGCVDVTVLTIGESVLAKFLGRDLSLALLEKIGIAAINTAKTACIPQPISSVLQSSLQHRASGRTRTFFLQAQVLEYLSLLAEHLLVENVNAGSTLSRDDAVRSLHDNLLRHPGKLPSQEKLSRDYGMSAKTLNDGFKAIYGQTIAAFLLDYRLETAHRAIAHSNVELKVLSNNLGYSHVNNFAAAFKKKFGYAPGKVRKN